MAQSQPLSLKTETDENKATIRINGKLAVSTAPDLEQALSSLPGTVNDITFDMTDTEYISSAGLRVCVATTKLAESRGGSFHIVNPSEAVFEVFEMTGLADVLDISRNDA